MFAFYTSPSAVELDMVTSGGPFCASKSERSKWEVLVCFQRRLKFPSGKITTFSENPKWGLPYVGLWKIVCNAPLLLYNTLIISEEVEIPNRQSWDKITTFFQKSEVRRIARKTPIFDFTQPSSFQRRLKFPTDLECK